MKVSIEINCDNAAFEDDRAGEISRILKDLSKQFEEQTNPYKKIYDVNGNPVGHCDIIGAD